MIINKTSAKYKGRNISLVLEAAQVNKSDFNVFARGYIDGKLEEEIPVARDNVSAHGVKDIVNELLAACQTKVDAAER